MIAEPYVAAERYLAELDDAAATDRLKLDRRWAAAANRATAEGLDVVKTGDSDYGAHWSVCHPDGGRCYHVGARKLAEPDVLTCTCAAAAAGDPVCKHRAAVRAHEAERLARKPAPPAPRITWPAPKPAAPAPADPRRAAIDAALAHLGYLWHHAALDGAERDSLSRALRALNQAR